MKIISLFGAKNGTGTWDCIYDNKKYSSMEDAQLAKDYVEGNFVDDDGIKKIELHHTGNPDDKLYHTLIIQNPIFGLDVQDDSIAFDIAIGILEALKNKQ